MVEAGYKTKLTGSVPREKTIGIVEVVALAASPAGVPPATSTAT
jgi:hypothetical protein